MHEFCLDLMQSGKNQLELDRESIVQLLHDVRSPTLQRKLLRIMLDIVDADQSLVGSESILLAEAMMIWGIGYAPSFSQFYTPCLILHSTLPQVAPVRAMNW